MRRVKAKVVKGAGRGKKIGVPTVNLDPSGISIKEGIYVCRILPPFDYWGVAHFGPKPTYNEGKSFEIFLFEYKGEEIPMELEVEVHKYLRKVEKFESSDAMVEQIKRDVDDAKKFITDFRKKS